MDIARYSYEEAVGLSDEPSYGSRLFNTALQGGLGAVTATIVAPEKDRVHAVIGGALAGIAIGTVAQSVLPLSGFMYWVRSLTVPAGSGALVGLYLMRQYKRELGYSVSGRPSVI